MESLWNQITSVVGTFIPNLIGALIILVVGLIIAWILAGVVRAILRRTKLDDRITLRLSVGQTNTQARHVEHVWQLIQEQAENLE